MYHKSTNPFAENGYYDSIEEMPNTAKVYFPNEKKPIEMTAEQMFKLSNEGWFTILHSVNWGSCDHWNSIPLSQWVNQKFLSYWRFTDKKNPNMILGYDRKAWSVRLTRDSNFRHSEVWNS